MNPSAEPNRDDNALLDALLAESAGEWSAAVRAQALAEFGAAQRRRRVGRFCAGVAAVVLLALAFGWWVRSASASGKSSTLASGAAAAARPQSASTSSGQATAHASGVASQPMQSGDGAIPSISEEEMLALFPPGSCVVAEVEGQPKLVFFDSVIEREGADYDPRTASTKN